MLHVGHFKEFVFNGSVMEVNNNFSAREWRRFTELRSNMTARFLV